MTAARPLGEPGPDPSTWQDRLRAALQTVEAPGKFAASAFYAESLPATPLLTVKGVGPLSLPLTMKQAAMLLVTGEPAPYGKGMDTVYDEAVRRATQLAPDLVTPAPDWSKLLDNITRAAAKELGVDPDCPVEAHLYKVLVYEPGGHFAVHRDTEKEPGMFGTLVVQLPVLGGHTGGSLEVTGPAGNKHVWQTAQKSSTSLQYCAFYADMEHQLSPVECGLRVVLSYNLVRPVPGSPPGPLPSFSGAALEQVTAAVRDWKELSCHSAGGGAQEQPALLAVPLEHKYTKANFAFGALKGRDPGLVALLRSCPRLEVHLALVTKRVYGNGYDEDEWGGRTQDGRFYYNRLEESKGDDSDEDKPRRPRYGMEKVHDTDYETHWVTPTFSCPPLRDVDLLEDLLCQKLGDRDTRRDSGSDSGSDVDEDDDDDDGNTDVDAITIPDEEEYEPYTGNEGPTVEYLYHTAVVVVWPSPNFVKVVKGLPGLLQLVANRLQSDPQQAASDMAAALQLLEADERNPVKEWKSFTTTYRRETADTITALRLLCQLAASGACERSEALRMGAQLLRIIKNGDAGVPAAGIPTDELAEVLAQTAAELDSDDTDSAIAALLQAWGPKQPGPCLHLVAASSAAGERQQRFCTAFMTALGIHEQGGTLPAAVAEADVVTLAVALLGAVTRIPPALIDSPLNNFVEVVLARPDCQSILMTLLKDQVVRGMAKDPRAATLVRARMSAIEALSSRGPPEFSWAMPDALVPDNKQIEAFLRGPTQKHTVRGFKDTGAAQKWAWKYFSKDRACAGGGSGYSATAEVAYCWEHEESHSSPVCCIITKTKAQHEAAVKLFHAQVAELIDLGSLL